MQKSPRADMRHNVAAEFVLMPDGLSSGSRSTIQGFGANSFMAPDKLSMLSHTTLPTIRILPATEEAADLLNRFFTSIF